MDHVEVYMMLNPTTAAAGNLIRYDTTCIVTWSELTPVDVLESKHFGTYFCAIAGRSWMTLSTESDVEESYLGTTRVLCVNQAKAFATSHGLVRLMLMSDCPMGVRATDCHLRFNTRVFHLLGTLVCFQQPLVARPEIYICMVQDIHLHGPECIFGWPKMHICMAQDKILQVWVLDRHPNSTYYTLDMHNGHDLHKRKLTHALRRITNQRQQTHARVRRAWGLPEGCCAVPCWDMGDPRLASLSPLC